MLCSYTYTRCVFGALRLSPTVFCVQSTLVRAPTTSMSHSVSNKMNRPANDLRCSDA